MWLLGVLKHKNPNILLALDFNTDYSGAAFGLNGTMDYFVFSTE